MSVRRRPQMPRKRHRPCPPLDKEWRGAWLGCSDVREGARGFTATGGATTMDSRAARPIRRTGTLFLAALSALLLIGVDAVLRPVAPVQPAAPPRRSSAPWPKGQAGQPPACGSPWSRATAPGARRTRPPPTGPAGGGCPARWPGATGSPTTCPAPPRPATTRAASRTPWDSSPFRPAAGSSSTTSCPEPAGFGSWRPTRPPGSGCGSSACRTRWSSASTAPTPRGHSRTGTSTWSCRPASTGSPATRPTACTRARWSTRLRSTAGRPGRRCRSSRPAPN